MRQRRENGLIVRMVSLFVMAAVHYSSLFIFFRYMHFLSYNFTLNYANLRYVLQTITKFPLDDLVLHNAIFA